METQSVEVDRNEVAKVATRSECSADNFATQTEFTRANVMARESQVRLVNSDEETNLDLFCYNHCSNDDDDFIKQCRGLVFNGDTLVMKAFSYTPEYNHTELETLDKVLSAFTSWKFYTAYEGALLRMFYFSGRWFLSTHRKLNAFHSKWSSRDSFGTLFKRALENEEKRSPIFAEGLSEGENILDRFQGTLDKNKQYMFLLRNNVDNRIVCLPPKDNEPFIYHVGTFIDGKLFLEENTNLPRPERLVDFENVDELVHYVETETDPRYTQGVVCFGPNNTQVKILHKEYQDMFKTRGNEPSVKFRYLQVRMNKKMTDMLYRLYPEMQETFDDYENIIYEIARVIHRAYVHRFIKKRWVTVPKEEFQVINECHAWHLTDRANNRISPDKIITMLNKQSPTSLNHMIRRYKTEQLKKQGALPRSYRGSAPNSNVNSPAIIPGNPGNLPPLVLKRLPPL